jgi:hypothetical protein
MRKTPSLIFSPTEGREKMTFDFSHIIQTPSSFEFCFAYGDCHVVPMPSGLLAMDLEDPLTFILSHGGERKLEAP